MWDSVGGSSSRRVGRYFRVNNFTYLQLVHIKNLSSCLEWLRATTLITDRRDDVDDVLSVGLDRIGEYGGIWRYGRYLGHL